MKICSIFNGVSKFRAFVLGLFLVGTALISIPSHAKIGEWMESEHARARIITAGAVSPEVQAPLYIGIEFEADPGWKLYWRTPGDSGLAPMVEWENTDNIAKTEMLWPVPTREVVVIDGITMENFIYKKALILPVQIMPEDSEKIIRGDIILNYAVCKEICIPLFANFTVEIAPNYQDVTQLARIRAYEVEVPQENGASGLEITKAAFYHADDGQQYMDVWASSDAGFVQPEVLVESDALFNFRKPEVTFMDRDVRLRVPVHSIIKGKILPVGKTLQLTLMDEGRAVEHSITVETSTKMLPEDSANILLILLFAFIGGLILNIMPCVLPVLSVKLLGIIKHGGKEKGHVRASFLASSAGVIVAFIVVGGITIALKALGNNVGWGFHFQSPTFLIALILILVLFASNMAGRFEIQLPVWLNTFAAKRGGHEHSIPGDFMTGVMATVLATPCSAPFLGTAVSFALSRGATEIFVIFTAMGIGLAFPYLLFAVFPGWAMKLPKPGAWMNKVKYVMAILLGLTALWLLWVLSNSLGMAVALVVFFSALLLKFFVELKTSILAKPLLRSVCVLITLTVAFTIPLQLVEMSRIHRAQMAEVWVDFDEAAIPMLVQEGEVVFVDVTADWCLTCKFNKFRVLDRAYMLQRFKELDVVPMRADLTTTNPDIIDYLKRNGRYGIPFNIVYGPAAPEGIPLSELISTGEVERALRKASGK